MHAKTHDDSPLTSHPGTDNDLEYYIRECGTILGIAEKLPPNERTANRILALAMRQLVNWKLLNPQQLK